MGQIFDTVLRFFEELNWSVAQLEGETVLQATFLGKQGTYQCYAWAREAQGQFVFHTVCPVAAPEDQRLRVAEFLTRANFGLLVGNFEMDLDDGEIRYKTCLELGGEPLTPALLEPIIYRNLNSVEKYLPGILAVIQANAQPAAAIRQVEAAPEGEAGAGAPGKPEV